MSIIHHVRPRLKLILALTLLKCMQCISMLNVFLCFYTENMINILGQNYCHSLSIEWVVPWSCLVPAAAPFFPTAHAVCAIYIENVKQYDHYLNARNEKKRRKEEGVGRLVVQLAACGKSATSVHGEYYKLALHSKFCEFSGIMPAAAGSSSQRLVSLSLSLSCILSVCLSVQ